MRPKLLIALLVIFPITLFFVARETASWRPKFVTKLPDISGKISPDGKRFVYLNKKSELEVMDLASQKVEFTIPLPKKANLAYGNLAWTPDSTQITGSWSDAVYSIKDFAEQYSGNVGALLYKLGGKIRIFKDKYAPNADNFSQIRISPDKRTLWLASNSNYRAWDIKTGRLLYRRTDEGGCGHTLETFGAISVDCRTFLEVGCDGLDKIDTSTHKLLPKPKELPNWADGQLDFSPDSTLVVHENWRIEVNGSSQIRMAETKTGDFLWSPPIWPYFSPDSKFCLLSFPDRIEKRDARTGKLQGKFPPVPKNTHPFQIINDEVLYSMDDKGNLYRSRLK